MGGGSSRRGPGGSASAVETREAEPGVGASSFCGRGPSQPSRSPSAFRAHDDHRDDYLQPASHRPESTTSCVRHLQSPSCCSGGKTNVEHASNREISCASVNPQLLVGRSAEGRPVGRRDGPSEMHRSDRRPVQREREDPVAPTEDQPRVEFRGRIGLQWSRVSSLSLLRRAKDGDERAVSRLFRRLLPGIRSWARRKLPTWARQRLETDDLVQEAFVNLHRHLKDIDPRRRDVLVAYLRQSIRNRIRDEVRRAGRVEVGGVEVAEPVATVPSPTEELEEKEQLRRYRAALARLSEDDQHLVVGRLELDFSYEQLALSTGRATPDSARVAVRRAVVRLVEEIARD